MQDRAISRDKCLIPRGLGWLRGWDLNPRPSGYEPDELPGCSTPQSKVCCTLGAHRGFVKPRIPLGANFVQRCGDVVVWGGGSKRKITSLGRARLSLLRAVRST